MVTGESLPVPKAAGGEVIGASVNTTGTLRCGDQGRLETRPGANRQPGAAGAGVQGAGQRLADRAAFWLVLVALIGGALTWRVVAVRESLATAMLFAVTVVVITCPDALGLATRPRSWSAPAWAPARCPLQERDRAGDSRAHRHRRLRQDRHADQGRSRSHRRRRRRQRVGLDEDSVLALAAVVERESAARWPPPSPTPSCGLPTLPATGFRNVPGHGALAQVEAAGGGRQRQAARRRRSDLGQLGARREQLAAGGQTGCSSPSTGTPSP